MADPHDIATLVAQALDGQFGEPLGDGLWGQVYDLPGGKVLKLSRTEGGIGDGRDLIRREAAALTFFEGYRGDVLALPAYHGHGEFDALRGGFSCWLLMDQLPGERMYEARYKAMSSAEKQALSMALGAGLATYHGLSLSRPDARPSTEELVATSRRDWLFDEMMHELSAEDQVIAKRLRARYRQLLEACETPVLAHGDVNPTNMLFAGGTGIGLVDFAESGWDLPAVDFAHWVTLGWLDQQVLDSYWAAGGPAFNDDALGVVGAINAMIGLVLDRRLGDTAAVKRGEGSLLTCLERAGLAG
ncbi:MAG: aminoglycoside phosphotransferase family protein [Alphaproteobacteria bacterium]|nr:aminoglycoside phosphotransferase family protein [Alphaproteobacteria bacterium SS10]